MIHVRQPTYPRLLPLQPISRQSPRVDYASSPTSFWQAHLSLHPPQTSVPYSTYPYRSFMTLGWSSPPTDIYLSHTNQTLFIRVSLRITSVSDVNRCTPRGASPCPICPSHLVRARRPFFCLPSLQFFFRADAISRGWRFFLHATLPSIGFCTFTLTRTCIPLDNSPLIKPPTPDLQRLLLP